jgi:hypothetical protein
LKAQNNDFDRINRPSISVSEDGTVYGVGLTTGYGYVLMPDGSIAADQNGGFDRSFYMFQFSSAGALNWHRTFPGSVAGGTVQDAKVRLEADNNGVALFAELYNIYKQSQEQYWYSHDFGGAKIDLSYAESALATVRFDDAGSHQWQVVDGHNIDARIADVEKGPSGHYYRAAVYAKPGTVGGVSLSQSNSSSPLEAFVQKLGPSGSSDWVRQWNSDAIEYIQSVEPLPSGEVLISGEYEGDPSFSTPAWPQDGAFIGRLLGCGSTRYFEPFEAVQMTEMTARNRCSVTIDGHGGGATMGFGGPVGPTEFFNLQFRP